MEQDNTPITPTINNAKPNNGLIFKIIAIVTSIIAIIGIGFGTYEVIDNSKKDAQIADLQKQILQLQDNQSSTPISTSEATRIKIISSSWSGWSANYQPTETESYCELTLHEKCIVKTVEVSDADGNEWEEEVLAFEITNINTDGVEIRTTQAFSDREDGIDLRSEKTDFVITASEPLKLKTPTMDAGDVFTLSLSK